MRTQWILKYRSFFAQPNLLGKHPLLGAPNEFLLHAPRNGWQAEKETKEPSIKERKATLEHRSGPCRIVLLHYCHTRFAVEERVTTGIQRVVGRRPDCRPDQHPPKTLLKLELLFRFLSEPRRKFGFC